MKKIFALIVLLFTITSINVFGQIHMFSKQAWVDNLNTFTFGCGINPYYNTVGTGCGVDMYISCAGIYFDYGAKEYDGKHSSRMGEWKGTSNEHFHFGYNIPISEYFTITPLIGRVISDHGTVSGDDWYLDKTYEYDRYVGGYYYYDIVNSYYVDESKSYIDYGVALNAIITPNIFSQTDIGLMAGIKITNHTFNINFGMIWNFKSTIDSMKSYRGIRSTYNKYEYDIDICNTDNEIAEQISYRELTDSEILEAKYHNIENQIRTNKKQMRDFSKTSIEYKVRKEENKTLKEQMNKIDEEYFELTGRYIYNGGEN